MSFGFGSHPAGQSVFGNRPAAATGSSFGSSSRSSSRSPFGSPFGQRSAFGNATTDITSGSELNEVTKAIHQAQLLDPPDFRISIEEYTWWVHSRKLSSSGFFKKLLSSSFLESKNKSVKLHDDDPRDVARLILWFYYGTYPTGTVVWSPNTPSIRDMIRAGAAQNGVTLKEENPHMAIDFPNKELAPRHFDMYLLADKYDIPTLREYCVNELKRAIKSEPEVVWMLVDFTKSAAEKAIKTDDIQAVVEDVLTKDPKTYIRHSRFEAKIKDSPEFAWTLVKKLVGGSP